ncbi:AraC family transcriptional regulator [Leucobacter luti]|uniref:AraC-like DNA-binding protein n=1 Tax=Leucobacter luti TaxID=340320 RepID=A0A4Q7U9E0_9MICO|nr:AraC family transcriptional regulator [Leucobacter luti]RZT68842.1 AraC-like DNA-binding protein [Leucobacter luti]
MQHEDALGHRPGRSGQYPEVTAPVARRAVDAELVRITVTVATRAGYHLGPALASAGISPESLGFPDVRISVAQAHAFVAAAQTTVPDLGLLVGARQTITQWGLLGLAMLSADSVRLALRTGLRYRALAGALAEVRLETDRAGVSLTAEPLPGLERVSRFVVEELFASVAGLLRYATGSLTGLSAEFAFPPPTQLELARRTFGANLGYRRPASRLRLSRGVLDRRLATADAFCRAKTTALLDAELVLRHRSHGFIARVEALLAARVAQAPPIAAVARHFHLSERTLRRRLADGGTTYRLLLDGVRRERARQLLAAGQLSADQVARACGFSDDRSLRRAQRRWGDS